jgi:hypothetical protein
MSMNRILFLPLLIACTGPGNDSGEAPGTPTPSPALEGCRSSPSAADRDRRVLVQTPYASDASQSTSWRALTLTSDGSLRDDGESFNMGRATGGSMAFTPDGSMGFIAQDDGSLGVVAIDDSNVLTVVEASFSGAFYASRVVSDPTGEVLWIIDPNWVDNGGGIYRAEIDCETGALSQPVRVLESQNAADLLLLPGASEMSRPAIVVGKSLPGADADTDTGWIDLMAPSAVEASTSAFGDDEAIFSDATLVGGEYALIGDYSSFSPVPNRVAVVALQDGELSAVQVLPDLLDPVAMVSSPWNDQVLVLSGYGDGLVRILPTGDPSAPFEDAGEPSYGGASPQLPTAAAQVEHGALQGRVLVTENGGIRQVQMSEGGLFEDIELQSIGSSYEGIAGAIGLAP